jgi:hypothetical protein
MCNIIVRGISERVRSKIQRIASVKNLSMNQILVQVINQLADEEGKEKEELQRHREAVKRLKELREKTYKKYGLSTDSTQIIRESRDARNENL